MADPELTRRDVKGRPTGLILMLHGGRANGLQPVDQRSASWRRSAWMMRQIDGRARRAGASVWLLRYQVRGWNAGVSSSPAPVRDARWALDEVRRELGSLPVVLLGHSMGARTAVAVADDDNVTGVVALAPWFPPGEPVAALAGKHLTAAHGSTDKVTSPRETAAFLRRANAVAASTEMHDMGPVGHYMFRRVPRWNEFALGRSLSSLDISASGGHTDIGFRR